MLEQFIQENRAAFDTESPPTGSWAAIEAELPEKEKTASEGLNPSLLRNRRIRLRAVMRMAAAVVVLLGLGVLLGTYIARPDNNVANSLSDISGEYAEVEYFYSQQVNYNLKQLEAKGVDTNVLNDIKDLEKEFEELKKELGRTQNDEQVIHAMIENYRTKINILERVLNRIDANAPNGRSL